MTEQAEQKVKPVCPDCGSDAVQAVNRFHFEWNAKTQDWDWGNEVYEDGAHYHLCQSCFAEIEADFVPIEESETV